MTTKLTIEGSNLMVLTISRRHGKEDAVNIREELMKLGATESSIKLLVILEAFEGWDDADWDDPRLAEADQKLAPSIEKVAFVGDPRWEEPATMLAVYPFTSTAMQYFKLPSGEAEARAWLESSS